MDRLNYPKNDSFQKVPDLSLGEMSSDRAKRIARQNRETKQFENRQLDRQESSPGSTDSICGDLDHVSDSELYEDHMLALEETEPDILAAISYTEHNCSFPQDP